MNGLKMTGIYKSFNHVSVLEGVDLEVKKGEVHALLGMNGAGKSTLMKILAGDILPDKGTITIDGKQFHFTTPIDAMKAGVGHVVQEVDAALFPTLSVCENIVASGIVEHRIHPFLSWGKQKQRAQQLLERVGLKLDIDKLVNECSLHEKQLIVLGKVLSSSARYIILDEPTAPLSEKETKTLFGIIKHLKSNGISFIYISHKLREIKEICDHVTILRDGKVVHNSPVSEISIEEMIDHMAGAAYKPQRRKRQAIKDEVAFEVRNLWIPKTKTTVNLKVRKGEIVGIAGLVGAGKTELAQSMFGLEKTQGKWFIDGNEIYISSPEDAVKAGICFIPEERRRQGLFLNETVQTNITIRRLASLTTFQWISKQRERETTKSIIRSLKIRPSSPDETVKNLSGGNQQKVVIGKWLHTDGKIFIFDEPTKGIDANAKAEILSIIESLSNEGKAVLYLTSEFQELLDISDTIYVMVNGELVKRFPSVEVTTEKLLYYSSGGDDSCQNLLL